MPLVTMTEMLQAARAGGYAVGAFNILDYNSTRAIVRAAEEAKAPVIIQTSVKTVRFWGENAIAGWLRELADMSPVPVALHLDHCKEVDVIARCIQAGWTSVMIDASSLPFEKNLAVTRKVVEIAAPMGVSVEAELGEIGGVEDDISVADEDAHLVNPEKALFFWRELALAAFAPAIGTAHGVYKGTPKLAFDRLAAIAAGTSVPLVLHGGTGLSDEAFHQCIAHGCAKINISTQLKYAFIDSVVEYHVAHPDYDPLKVLQAQFERMKDEVRAKIVLFGGAGKVNARAEVLS